jgi:hypothetical protein
MNDGFAVRAPRANRWMGLDETDVFFLDKYAGHEI